ncbi:MAG: ABC transporter ATP-binding protein [Chloroflexi bacterium]|nr:ABC transporter ATP-binding protein [Chloroflexota bacterium]
MTIAIEVQHLSKAYGSIKAVDDISFHVEMGEIFGMVGPNGAGKTTTIECIEGLRWADGGEVRVLGLDPRRDGYKLRQSIGMQLQESALPLRLKVWEACDLFASFYEKTIPWEPLLEEFGLTEKRNTTFEKLSGGQKQRLFIALALLNDPEIVFFDELTTGLDPQARRTMWDMVKGVRDRGKTVFLTTHYMEEAERLCDRVAIIDQGRLVALDAPANLIRSLGLGVRFIFTLDGQLDPAPLYELEGVEHVKLNGERVVVLGESERLAGRVLSVVEKQNCLTRDFRIEQPNLEDVFLALTGRDIRD